MKPSLTIPYVRIEKNGQLKTSSNAFSVALRSKTDILFVHCRFVCNFFSRQKSRAGVQGAPALSSAVQVKGPDEEKIKQILARTGYTLDVTTGMNTTLLLLNLNSSLKPT